MVTGIYAALLAVIYIGLSLRVIKLRVKHQVGVGDGDVAELALAIRVHANFAEYVPFCLVLLLVAELNHFPVLGIHLLGFTLCAARLAHVSGLSKSKGKTIGRKWGMLLTFGLLLVLAIINLYIGIAFLL